MFNTKEQITAFLGEYYTRDVLDPIITFFDSELITKISETRARQLFSPISHTHDDRYATRAQITGFLGEYYEKTEADARFALKGDGGGGSTAWNAITGKPSTFPPSAHNHDERYWTISNSLVLLGNKVGRSTQAINNPGGAPRLGRNDNPIIETHAFRWSSSGFLTAIYTEREPDGNISVVTSTNPNYSQRAWNISGIAFYNR